MKKESTDKNSLLIKKLKKDISFNGIKINTIWVELEHINRGLVESEAGKKVLKSKKRTTFSLNDVEKFVMLIDGEVQAPKAYEGRNSRFMLQVQCPLEGKFKDRWFIMIFKTYYDDKNVLHTITLYPMKTK